MIAAVLALFAAMRAGATTACEAHAARTHQVLLADSLDNWEPVSDRTVLIWTRHSTRANLVRLDKPLAGLADASFIYLVDGDHDTRISPCGRDGVAIGDGTGVGQIARIVSIEPLSDKRTTELDPGARTRLAASFRV